MKNKAILTVFGILTLFICCKTNNLDNKTILVNSNKVNYNTNTKLNIYFPEFYNENGEVLNGDGIVIIFPNKKVMVVDGFIQSTAPQYIQFLKNLGIKKIDYLVNSHYHHDHIGTFYDLFLNFEVDTFYSNGAPYNNIETNNVLKYLSEHNVKQQILKAGDKINISEDIYIDVLWPSLTEDDIYNIWNNPGKTAKLGNLASLVFKMNYKNFSILFTGDIYKEGDKKLVKKYGNYLKSTILKVPHHGEWYTANSPKFIKIVNADYGVIQDNRYIKTIIKNRYKRAGTKLLYRLTPGYIHIETDGDKYSISQSDNYLK